MFLVALLPPEPVYSEVWALKQEVHQRTGSRNAVRLPPHITLVPPLRQPDSFEQEFRAGLAEFARTQRPFSVGLRDFRWFGNRTLFVHVAQPEAVQAFHAALTAWCTEHLPQVPRENRPFTPHMTLATRDLPTSAVPELKADFAHRHYEATFEVHSFVLFRHDGQKWQNVAEFSLSA
ncbi:2'-5' RNA ligase family protein [Hymenobacter cellulosivorans]|uniref:2'-5' RNA ligase family protein n=1 Tax=Hymenobacter cellulosivorans TaxID=2932249 RepID=A0ABY4F5T4_9BACT|nr:2'-5' RNA ligase family protein [Hymenobacter cellulosivorans]UOQ51477.1 2'-5' RNA ligase family protein [Hymenobacter cellulosivorans]